MHRSRLGQLIIDCHGDESALDRAGAFWSAALGWAASALPDPQDHAYRQLATPAGHPNILLQAVDHPSRVHLDIESTDVEAEVKRLETLGARRVAQVRTWWVMEAPSGHRFCVLQPQRPDLDISGTLWK
jgi:predicted enzyme related to lactoylglutathione lyase